MDKKKYNTIEVKTEKRGSNHSTTKKELIKEQKAEKKREKKLKRKKSKARKIVKVILLTLLLVLIIAIAVFAYKTYKNGGGLQGALATAMGHDENTLKNLEPIRILVMGISGVDNYKLADTIMIAQYNPKTQEAALMSIPRDTYVGAKDKNSASKNYLQSYKINSVFRNLTNIPEAVERISDVTNLELDNYVIIDTEALIKLVDAIGGVTFDVPIDMNYDDITQDLHIHLTAGEQLIDGAKAEQLLRFRHNNDGTTYDSSYGQQDLGRMRTQREFITATLKQTLIPANITKISEILDIINTNVTTNMDFNTLKDYIPYAINFSTDNLKTGMLPVSVETCNGVSICVTKEAEATEVVDSLFNSTTTETIDENGNVIETTTTAKSDVGDVKVQVLDGTGSSTKLKDAVSKLVDAGFTVSKQGTTTKTTKTTITNRTNQSTTMSTKIKEAIGMGTVTTGTDDSNVDYTIVLGEDYK